MTAVLERADAIRAAPARPVRRHEVARLAHAKRQFDDTGKTWDSRLNRIKRIAEEIQRKRGRS
ncbi:hypothetical protein [Yinghuangia soli]|uniref:Uncharacterized protein n=1 Tax=Yinghuangia soli TaxID=2908204 RepID=A0AA41PVT4_9ACTN|nr:hypothetical protein [Yinghuangia soli]MCF2525819.1 hypothetical protein [Yinghuangia soli]